MGMYYILDNHKVVPTNQTTWANFMEGPMSNRRVAEATIGDIWVSTVFLGLDHAFGDEKPMLFETMIFGGPLDQTQERCSTWEEAEALHQKWCDAVKEL